MGKRYYWLKLPEDFFGDKAIKRLRKIAGGDTYVIIYLKMMLRSLKDDGYLYYDGLEEDFPAELALDLDEEEDNVQVTLNFLLQHGKLEIRSEQEYFMPDMKQSIGSETAAAERKRAERERKRQQSLLSNEPETSGCDNVTGVSQMCHGEIDIDREIEKDIYLSILDGEAKENLSTFQQSAQPPTLLEVKQYAEQKGIHTDVQKFYSYYSERGWKTKNGQPITNWKGTLAYWGKTDGTCQGKRKPETYVSENAAAYESLIYNLQENDSSDKA